MSNKLIMQQRIEWTSNLGHKTPNETLFWEKKKNKTKKVNNMIPFFLAIKR